MTYRSGSALLVMVGLVIAGCGGDEGESADRASAQSTTAKVEIIDFEYGPETIEVAAGTEVTWTNSDSAPHTATANDSSFDTGDLDKGDSKTVAFDEPGKFTYYCRFHPFMKATVEVR